MSATINTTATNKTGPHQGSVVNLDAGHVNVNMRITMDNNDSKAMHGHEDHIVSSSSPTLADVIPTTVTTETTFDTHQHLSTSLTLGQEKQTNEVVFTVVAVGNNVNELIHPSFHDVSLSKDVQLNLIPMTTQTVSSTINTEDGQLLSTQNSYDFNPLDLVTSSHQHSGQAEELQEVCAQKPDSTEANTVDVSMFKPTAEDSENKTATNQKKPRVNCLTCGQDFSDLPSMKRHQLIHTNAKPFQCEFCDKAFRRKDNLREHRNIHTLENVYACERCGKTFPRKYTYKVHKARFCIKGKSAFDSGSNRENISQARSTSEVKTVNHTSSPTKTLVTKTPSTNKLSDPCHVCNKTFRDSSTLKRHLLTHSDERPFKCDQCNKSFRRKDHLQEHVVVHNEVRPFHCPQCGKSFSRKNGLKTHMIRTSHGTSVEHSIAGDMLMVVGSDLNLLVHSQDGAGNSGVPMEENQTKFQETCSNQSQGSENEGEASEIVKDRNAISNGESLQSKVNRKKNKDVNNSIGLDLSDVHLNVDKSEKTSGVTHEHVLVMERMKVAAMVSEKNEEILNAESETNILENNPSHFGEFTTNVSRNIENESKKDSVDSENGWSANIPLRNEVSFQCPNCSEVFHEKNELWHHFQNHLAENMIACEQCLETFTETQQFQEHQNKCGYVYMSNENQSKDFPRNKTDASELSSSQLEDLVPRDSLEDTGEMADATLAQISGKKDSASRASEEERKVKGSHMCSICNKQLRDATALRRHSLVHSDERPHGCEQCSKTFRRRDHLKSHTIAFHSGTTEFPCKHCDMVFMTRYSLASHWKSCKMVATIPAAAQISSPSCRNAAECTSECRSCPICHKIFKDPSTQRRHVRVHSNERPYTCQLCGKSFRRKDNLKEHMLCHSEQKPFTCADCGKTLSRRSSLTNHRNICLMRKLEIPAVALNTSTTSCDGELVQDTMMENEEMCVNTEKTNTGAPTQTTDEPIDQFHCHRDEGDDDLNADETDEGLGESDVTDLDRERGGDPGNEKGFSCGECGKSFRAKWTLKYHERVHTGEKPYTCLTCDRQFRQPSHLKIHQRTHSGERPYVCEACGRAFIDSSTMRRHARLHKDTLGGAECRGTPRRSIGCGENEIQPSDEITVDGSCLQMAVSSTDETIKSVQPISADVLSGISQSDVSLVHVERTLESSDVPEITLSSKIATLEDIHVTWQQNPETNLEEQIPFLFSAKETNKKPIRNSSENMTF